MLRAVGGAVNRLPLKILTDLLPFTAITLHACRTLTAPA
jgi:hypothetical protein